VNSDYPFYYSGYRANVKTLTTFVSKSSSTSNLELNYVSYSDEDGSVQSIFMANGDIWYALNFFTSPFEYQLVDCANSGQEQTVTYKDALTTLLFEGTHTIENVNGGTPFDSACWVTSCDGSNYFFNCLEDSSSYRLKAEWDHFGNIKYFHFDTDLFFMLKNEGTLSPIRIIYDRSF